MTEERSPRQAVSMPALFLLVLAPLAAFALTTTIASTFRDGDTYWHLAAGRMIIAHHAVPLTDPFSYTAIGKPWFAHEWLSEVIMYLSYAAGGWSGLMLPFALAVSLTYALLVAYMLRWQSAGATLLMLVYVSMGVMATLTARPHVLAMPLLVGWTILHLDAREADRPPAPAWALLMLLWVNLHGSFVFGLAITGFFALEALVNAKAEERRQVLLSWTGFGTIAGLATLANPHGLGGALHPVRLMSMQSLKLLGEWKPSGFETVSVFEVVLLSGIFFLLYRPIKIPPLRLMLLLLLVHQALSHNRHQAVLVMIGALLVSRPLGEAWREESGGVVSARPLATLWHQRRELMPIGVVSVLLFIGVAVGRLATPLVLKEDSVSPITAVEHVPSMLAAKPVFNEYALGGLLIWRGIRNYIDGRNDMYGDDWTERYYHIAHEGDEATWHQEEKRWKFGWTILPPSSPLVKILDREAGWHRYYADQWAVIHVADRAGLRPPPAPASGTSGSPAATKSDKATRSSR